jgi:polysaccharide biosynthesis protein PslG
MRRTLFAAALLAVLGPLSVPAGGRASVPHSFFGVNPVTAFKAKDLVRLQAARVRTARLPFNWSQIEPTPGVFDWSSTDQSVAELAEHGVRVLPWLYYSPSYAAGSSHEPPLGSPAAKQYWQQFVAAAVARYGPQGTFWTQNPLLPSLSPKVWQIWNEQNSTAYFEPKPSVNGYATLLKLAAQAIRPADPKAKILLGGMFGTPSPAESITAWRFLGRLYKVRGAKRDFDAVAVHPYAGRLSDITIQMRLLRQKMRAHHDAHTPTWITELGFGSAPPNRNFVQLKGRRGQARWLKKSFRLVLRKRHDWKVQGLDWFDWRDPPPGSDLNCGFCKSAGLFESNLDPKPSWRAFKRFTR